MKKIFLILFCLLSYSLFAQQTGVGYNWSCLGNVSIGTTSATAKLNVVGASILNGNITSKAGIYFQERFGDSALFDIHGTDYQSSATMGIGSRAGRKSQTSGGCTYVGSDAGYSNIGGDYNTYIGGASGYKNLSDANTFIGYDAGRYNINGQRNTIIGAESGTLSTFNGSNNIFIGYNVAAKEKGSNKIYLESYNATADSTNSTIYADQKNHLINFYNKVSINGTANASQTENLWVNGTMKLQGGATIDTIETTLTNSATNIPTSSAVFSGLAGKANVSDSGMWTLNGVDIYSKNSGNVGIGYTNPTSKLAIYGMVGIGTSSATSTLHTYGDNITTGGGVIFEEKNDVDNQLIFQKYNRNFILRMTQSEDKFKLSFNGRVAVTDNIIVADSLGNVGIGYTNPQAKLDVNGTIKLQGGATIDTIETTLTNSATNIPTSSAVFSELAGKASISDSGMWAVNGTTIYNKNTGSIGIGTTSPSDINNKFEIFNDNNVTTYPDSGFAVTKSGDIFMGYPIPTSKGYVSGQPILQMQSRATNVFPYIYMRNHDNTMGLDILPSSTGAIKFNNRYDNDNADFSFTSKTDGEDERFLVVFKGSGNVGIGITNPTAKFVVKANKTVSTDSILLFNGNLGLGTTTPSGRFHAKNSVTGNDSDFCVRKSGRVGICTTNPQTALHIWTANGQTGRLRIGHSENGRAALADSMSGLELQMTSVTANQYSPVIKFQSNDAQFTTTTPKPFAMIAGRATQTYDDDNDGGGAIDFATNANNPGATAIPTVRMTIDQSGNVGIGSTVPTHKLKVTGGYAMADSLIIPNTKPKAPVAGAMRWSNDTLYFYNGSAWKWAVFN